MFLEKYVKKKFKNWYRILSKIGIYHLGGDFWSHLLYTIPKSPYSSIVVLDGDKREMLPEIIKNYSKIDKDRFRISKLRDIPKLTISCPIYCLIQNDIEDYLETEPETQPIIKEEGPTIAYRMENIPQEIEELFDAIFQMADIRNA